MAIVRSHSVGNAKKSAGLITYRTIRGRQIASQKRAGWISGQTSQGGVYKYGLQQTIFGLLNAYSGKYALSIKRSFNRTKYGSERNFFSKLNYGVFAAMYDWAMANPSESGISHAAGTDPLGDTTLQQWEDALALYLTAESTAAVARIYRSGLDKVYLSSVSGKLTWTSVQDPIPNPVVVTTSSATALSAQSSRVRVSLSGANFASIESVEVTHDGETTPRVPISLVLTDTTASFLVGIPAGTYFEDGDIVSISLKGVAGDMLEVNISVSVPSPGVNPTVSEASADYDEELDQTDLVIRGTDLITVEGGSVTYNVKVEQTDGAAKFPKAITGLKSIVSEASTLVTLAYTGDISDLLVGGYVQNAITGSRIGGIEEP